MIIQIYLSLFTFIFYSNLIQIILDYYHQKQDLKQLQFHHLCQI
jgi:F0F1-type ATP synthase membrane subunit a